MKNIKIKQSGAVSLFVVIFTALLITVVTVSFVRIMIQDQQQATVTDLSQSAYDSAQAGVEDAKRALLKLQTIESKNIDVDTDKWSTDCNVAVQTLDDIPKTADEIKIQTGGEANGLDQAYTCVKVTLDTPDYRGELSNNSYNFIPLRGNGSFDGIKIEWFSPNDVDSTYGEFALQLDNQTPLPSTWAPNRPPIIRAQLVQFGKDGFKLTDFNFDKTSHDNNKSNTDTLFLYPSSSPAFDNKANFIDDAHSTVNDPIDPATPESVLCKESLDELYSCSVDIKLPTTIGTGDREAYLFIGALYNKASYKVSLINAAGTAVNFDNVQPEIDSTGRTSDLFRRVQTRVELTDINFPYPRAAIDVAGNLCKDFMVTNDTDDWDTANTGVKHLNGDYTLNGCTF